MSKKKAEDSEKKSSKSKAGPAAVEGLLSLASVVAGAFAGAAIGKPALAVGAGLATGGLVLKTVKPNYANVGHYGMLFGLGVVVGHADVPPAVAPSTVQGLSGMEGFLADATARAKNYAKGMVKKTYLDNIPAIAKATGTDLGAVEYYAPDGSPISMSTADALIKQLQQASVTPVSGYSMLEDLKGLAGSQASILDFAA